MNLADCYHSVCTYGSRIKLAINASIGQRVQLLTLSSFCVQLFIRDQHSLKYKFRSWFSNLWNRFDATMYVLFILSIVLRYQLSGESFVWARITYSITLAMFFLRFMQYFYAEKNMGPKVIMIRKMVSAGALDVKGGLELE